MGKLSKAKKLTSVEKYCIQGMLYNEMEANEIGLALGRDEPMVEDYLDELEHSNSNSLVINETAKGNKGVSIMTKEASERVDASRENLEPATNRGQRAIHTIHD